MIDKDRNNIRVELTGAATAAADSLTHVVTDKRIQILRCRSGGRTPLKADQSER